MIEVSQGLLLATTLLILVALLAYALAIASSRTARNSAAIAAKKQKVAVGAGGPSIDEAESIDDAGSVATPAAKPKGRGIAWYGSAFSRMAFVTITASLALRWIATGHAPMSNHYEFAVSFVWGMIAAWCYFEWRFKIRTLSVIVLPVILAMALYASTLSYEEQPLMPALQNSPLLTTHVLTAALAYGAAAISFAAAVMYLISPNVRWKGWPKPEVLDEIGYKAVVVTFPLLTIMLILGAIWADIAWGRYWSWDPKETSALVTWLIYGAYLHARVVRDWRGNKAAWLLIIGFGAVLFTYFGNLFFGGLHSYA